MFFWLLTLFFARVGTFEQKLKKLSLYINLQMDAQFSVTITYLYGQFLLVAKLNYFLAFLFIRYKLNVSKLERFFNGFFTPLTETIIHFCILVFFAK